MRSKSLILFSLAGATLLIHGTVIAQERLMPILPIQFQPNLTFSFGMIGLGANQTARLNVVNTVRTPPPVAISIAQIPCKVELDLYDGQGKLIKQKIVANLGLGQADFLDVVRSELNTTVAHADVTGAVKVGSTQSFFCNISTTLEVFDNVTGATNAILTNANPSAGLIFPVLSGTPQLGQE